MKTIMITGANRGIGLGLAEYYLHAGWQVLVTSRCGLFQLSVDQPQKPLHPFQLDVTNEASIQLCAKSVSQLTQTIDVLINNAGVAEHQAFGEWTQAAFINNYVTNALGPALLIQALNSLFIPGSKMIQLSSGLASIQDNLNPLAEFDAYAMSKAALNMMNRRLAAKLADRKIISCAISPGWVRTQMGGANATSSIEETAVRLAQTIDKLNLSDSGKFLDPDGKELTF